jgi:uncharacterized membrane protein
MIAIAWEGSCEFERAQPSATRFFGARTLFNQIAAERRSGPSNDQHLKDRSMEQTTPARNTTRARVAAIPARGQLIHQMLVPFSIAYFIGAFVTDLAYWRTAQVMWERFSVWMIAAGLVIAGAAILAALIDLLGGRQRPAWVHALTYVAAIILSLFNVFIHSRDGYTAVVPAGLALSAVVTILLLSVVGSGWTLTYRYRAGARK